MRIISSFGLLAGFSLSIVFNLLVSMPPMYFCILSGFGFSMFGWILGYIADEVTGGKNVKAH